MNWIFSDPGTNRSDVALGPEGFAGQPIKLDHDGFPLAAAPYFTNKRGVALVAAIAPITET